MQKLTHQTKGDYSNTLNKIIVCNYRSSFNCNYLQNDCT